MSDLVAEGKTEEASATVEQQVESYLTKLLIDTSFRCVPGCWGLAVLVLVLALVKLLAAGGMGGEAQHLPSFLCLFF
jgi:hypothetical protein